MAYKKIEVENSVLKNKVHYLTNDYKTRNSKYKNHNGIDLIGKNYAKDYIIAYDSGTVVKKGYDSSRGYNVAIEHNGYQTLYYHMKKDSILVSVGEKVTKGQVIGYMGSSGNTTGAHLHFGVQKDGKYVDPLPYLQKKINDDNNENVYIVKKGDNLTKIAKMYNTTYQVLADYNNIKNPNLITVGQKIKIPNEKTNFINYVVKSGDNLTKIAKKYNTDWKTIYNDNKDIIGDNPNLIKANQILKIRNS